MATEDELLMNSVFSLIKQIINRDEGWKEYYANEMNSINEEKMKIIYMKDIQMNLNQKNYSHKESMKQLFKKHKSLLIILLQMIQKEDGIWSKWLYILICFQKRNQEIYRKMHSKIIPSY